MNEYLKIVDSIRSKGWTVCFTDDGNCQICFNNLAELHLVDKNLDSLNVCYDCIQNIIDTESIN